ncbi:MAG: MBL fold metallo-hydrolase, partial [Bdellovibrionota bacterium]
MFNLGFETIANATLVAHDKVPVLVTDPWVRGSAYFGSWTLSHEVPAPQMEAILKAKYVWFSHGHPDHLNGESLDLFRNHTVLLPDHVGSRILNDLTAQGFKTQVLKDNVWVSLSERIRVLCIADYNQDAILLVEIGKKHLVVNLNDAYDRGWADPVRKMIKNYPKSFMLALSGFGDAYMMNYFDEKGGRILPPAAKKAAVGEQIARATQSFGVTHFVPFSSMHKYQRTDSAWANEYTTSLDDYGVGFESSTSELLPAYVRYDCEADSYERIQPPEAPSTLLKPEDFGDNWGDALEQEDFKKVAQYFRSIEHLDTFLDHVNFRVGGKDNVIEFKRRGFNRGVTFEAPRGSLMTAVGYEVFDDLLICNFVKATLHGKWPQTRL